MAPSLLQSMCSSLSTSRSLPQTCPVVSAAPQFDYCNTHSSSILNAPPSLQVLWGARENALAESESTLQSSRGGWEHLGVLRSSGESYQSVWEGCVWLPDRITFCWWQTRRSKRPHGVRRPWEAFPTPRHRKTGSALDQRGGETATSSTERRWSEESKGGDGSRKTPPGWWHCTTPEVDSTVQEIKVERVLAKSEGGQGMESSKIREPSALHDRGSLIIQRRQVCKLITRDRGNAEACVISSQWQRALLRTTSVGNQPRTRHRPSSWTRFVFSIKQESTRARQAIVKGHMTARDVAEREDCEADKGGHPRWETPMGLRAGYRSGDSHTWQSRLHAADSLSVHITGELHWICNRNSSRWAAVRRCREERTTEHWTIRKQKWKVSHECRGHHGRQSSCSLEEQQYNRRASHGH